MGLSDLTSRAAVIRAISECKHLGRDVFLRKYGYRPARQYMLRYEDQLYDSKAIAGVAYGYEHPGKGMLRCTDFYGGVTPGGAATRLSALGFEIVDLEDIRKGQAARAQES